MGEETYKPGMRLGPEPTFVVDPIDGMSSLFVLTNFVEACLKCRCFAQGPN